MGDVTPEKKPYWTIYLDMDGVVADLMSAIIELLYGESAVEPILRGWPKGTYNMGDAIGQSEDRIWTQIRGEGSNFWRELGVYGWAHPLVNRLHELGDVVFLSSPSRDASSAAGKLQWIGDNFSLMARDYILTPKTHKWRLARPSTILIDDSQENCDTWVAAGGQAIVFPRPWNSAPEPPPAMLSEYVVGQVIEITKPKKKQEPADE